MKGRELHGQNINSIEIYGIKVNLCQDLGHINLFQCQNLLYFVTDLGNSDLKQEDCLHLNLVLH